MKLEELGRDYFPMSNEVISIEGNVAKFKTKTKNGRSYLCHMDRSKLEDNLYMTVSRGSQFEIHLIEKDGVKSLEYKSAEVLGMNGKEWNSLFNGFKNKMGCK